MGTTIAKDLHGSHEKPSDDVICDCMALNLPGGPSSPQKGRSLRSQRALAAFWFRLEYRTIHPSWVAERERQKDTVAIFGKWADPHFEKPPCEAGEWGHQVLPRRHTAIWDMGKFPLLHDVDLTPGTSTPPQEQTNFWGFGMVLPGLLLWLCPILGIAACSWCIWVRL